MEYLLSLPHSRLKLVGIKIFPRLAAVLVFYAVFLILYLSGGDNSAALSFVSFTVIYFSLFLIALSLSSSSDNFVFLSLLSLFSSFVFLGLLFLLLRIALHIKGLVYYELKISPFFTGEMDSSLIKLIIPVALGILLPLLVSFLLSFKKFDIRPARVYNKRYLKFFTPIFILGLTASFLFAYQAINTGSSSYYLTRDLKLIESNEYSDIKIYEGNKVYKIKGQFEFYWPSLEDNEYLYDIPSPNRINRFSTSKHSMQVFYEAPQGRRTSSWIFKYENSIAFTERKRDYSDLQLVLVDILSGSVKRIAFDREPLKNYNNAVIFGANRAEGKRFWLIFPLGIRGEKPVLRLWEDGTAENIGTTQKWPSYINRALLTYSQNEIIISEEKEGKFEAIQKIPNSKGFIFWLIEYVPKGLNKISLKEIYGWKTTQTPEQKEALKVIRKYAKLDLEKFEIKELGDLKGEPIYCQGVPYSVEDDEVASSVRVYHFEEDQEKLLREFKGLDMENIYRNFQICDAGIVVKRGRKIRVYAFPDLKEIKFKKL
jgi:hypothetical protein